MNREEIKVGFCVAYDWGLLAHSLPLVYEAADIICLSIDKDRISWSGKPFSWDESAFQALLRQMDPAAKIRLLEEDFHLPGLTPMQNELRQRQRMAEFMGPGGWHVQLDTDEFFLNFDGFVDYLKKIKTDRKVNVVCPWITLYKQGTGGFFYVKPERFSEVEYIQVATRWPYYEYGRRNGYFNIHCNFPILHLSWARSESEMWEKLNNWGHTTDFDVRRYYELWQQVNKDNYHHYKNFHHLNAKAWPRLGFLVGKSVDEMIHAHAGRFQLPVSRLTLWFKNSLWVSRLRALQQRIRIFWYKFSFIDALIA